MIFFPPFGLQAGDDGFNIPAVIDVGDKYGILRFHHHRVSEMIDGNQTIASQNETAPGVIGNHIAVNNIEVGVFG